MAKKSKKSGKGATKTKDYIVVTIAQTEDEAKNYQTLLKNDDIPALIRRQQPEEFDTGGFAVMVPEEYADEAYVIVESNDTYDDYFDMTVEEQQEDFDDDDLMDDNY